MFICVHFETALQQLKRIFCSGICFSVLKKKAKTNRTVYFFFFVLFLIFDLLSVFTRQSMKKKKSLNLVEKSNLRRLLKALLDSMCLLEGCQ